MKFSHLRDRWRNLTSDDRRIAIGAFVVVFFVVLTKGFAALKESAMAWRYGTGGVADAYQLALTAVTWIPSMLVSVSAIMLIPLLASAYAKAIQAERQFLSEVNGATLTLGVLLSALCFVAAEPLMVVVGSKLSADTQHMAITLVTLMCPLAAISLINGVLATRLQAAGKHINVLLDGAPPLVLFCFLLYSVAYDADLTALVLGTLLGAIVQTSLLMFVLHKEKVGVGGFSVGFQSAHWQQLYRAIAVMSVGVVAMGLTVPIDLIYLARIGDGAIASFNYANRILALLIALGALAIARSTLPIFSAAIARGESARVKSHAFRWAFLSGCCGIVVAVIAWGAAPLLVELMFQRGTFTQQDAMNVITIFRMGLFQLPFFFAGLVLVQYLAANKSYTTISASGLVAVLVKLSLIPWLATWLAVEGVMLSSAGMQLATLGWLAYASIRPHPRRASAT